MDLSVLCSQGTIRDIYQKHEMGDEKNDTYEDNIKSQQDQKSNIYYCIKQNNVYGQNIALMINFSHLL